MIFLDWSHSARAYEEMMMVFVFMSFVVLFSHRRQFQEQCKLVLEENQLLMEQLDIQQNKEKDIRKTFVQESKNNCLFLHLHFSIHLCFHKLLYIILSFMRN